MCYLVASVGVHLSSCIYQIYYIMEYCIRLPSKYILIYKDSNFVMLRGHSIGCCQNFMECDKVQFSMKKK